MSINSAESVVAQPALEDKRVVSPRARFLKPTATVTPNYSRSQKCNKSSRQEKTSLRWFKKKSKRYNNFKFNFTMRRPINRVHAKLKLKTE